jgi:hypothetical protein
MLHLSRFQPDSDHFPEFLACLWQGPVPASLELKLYYYVDVQPLEMVLVWEGDDTARSFMERAFGGFGNFTIEGISDRTPAMAAALARDLEGFGGIMAEWDQSAEQIERGLDVRRRGMQAASQEDARAAARAWAAEAPGAS